MLFLNTTSPPPPSARGRAPPQASCRHCHSLKRKHIRNWTLAEAYRKFTRSKAVKRKYVGNSENPPLQMGGFKIGWGGALPLFLEVGCSCTKRASVILQRPKPQNYKTRFPAPYETYMPQRRFSESPSSVLCYYVYVYIYIYTHTSMYIYIYIYIYGSII